MVVSTAPVLIVVGGALPIVLHIKRVWSTVRIFGFTQSRAFSRIYENGSTLLYTDTPFEERDGKTAGIPIPMKQHLFSFFKAVVSAACVSIFIAGCTANNPDSLGDGDDTIDVVTIESLNIQVKDINKSLNEYKTTMNLLSSYVVELQNKVNALDGQGYTDLKSKVDALDGKVTAFESALKNLDGFTDLNSWVNNLNNGLNSLNTLQGAVNEAKTSIANITTRLNGLDQTTANIASELNTKTKQLTDDLSKCSTDISGMMDRLAALENSVGTLQQEIAALISAVQSVVVIPDYADGSVKMTDGQNNVLRFEVYPATAAQKLAEVGPSAFSLDCVETETRSSIFTNIPIIAVSFDGEVLSVTADGSGLKDSIKEGMQPANARLRITDGKVTRSSEYFALTYKTSSGEPILNGNSVTVGSEYISAGKEKLMGKASFSEADGTVEYGFMYWTNTTTQIQNPTVVKVDNIDADSNYSIVLTLSFNTTYYYKSFLSKNGVIYYGDTKSFTTTIPVSSIILDKTSLILNEGETATISAAVSPDDAFDKTYTWSSSAPSVATVDQSGKVTAASKGTVSITAIANDGSGKSSSCYVGVFSSSPIELSAIGRANCYIISTPDAYSFPATKGNSSESVGSVASVETLWESFGTDAIPSNGDIIRDIIFRTGSGGTTGTINFSTPFPMNNGNAVIAAKDASGNILWSWHIWVCDGYDPIATAQVYRSSSGTMMDRNLGATSATPGDVGALGLLYQWGRKDPFLSGSQISYETNNQTTAASTLSWPSFVTSDSVTGTIEYSISHPTTFISYYSSNDDCWQSTKTIYDPCPPGWRVPNSNIWQYLDLNWDSHRKGAIKDRYYYDYDPSIIVWYPAAGSLDCGDGHLYDVGSSCSCWTCMLSAYKEVYDLSLMEGHTSTSGLGFPNRSRGNSVRCLKEE